MPRLPVDGNKVSELRITFGSKERMILEDLATSYRIDSISGNDSLVEVFSDTGKLIGALAGVGALLELLGITDVFDFDDDAKALVMEVKGKIADKIKERAKSDPVGLWADVLKATGPLAAPVRVAEYVGDKI